jgi:hypothetical protein
MRRGIPVLLLVALAACGDEGSPAVEGAEVTAPAPTSTSTTVPPTTIAPQSVPLALTGDGGSVDATLTYDGDRLCLAGTTSGLGAITSAHVHAGLAGESGPPVVDFEIRTDADGPFEGCATVGAEGGVVLVDPTSYYVDLHTADLPDGAVRAQVG